MNHYRIKYPSGKEFSLAGKFSLAAVGDLICPLIMSKGVAQLIDQRAIVYSGNSVVYSPRRNADGLHSVITDWLKSHPEWAADTNP